MVSSNRTQKMSALFNIKVNFIFNKNLIIKEQNFKNYFKIFIKFQDEQLAVKNNKKRDQIKKIEKIDKSEDDLILFNELEED